MKQFESEKLKRWFLENRRDLPWRQDPSPYAVWVSEVMLQQTQVSVVIPYFLRWMDRFPTIKSLSESTLDEVIKLWEGLGYYSRARNLHEGAKYVVKEFGGILPSDESNLSKIKGLGPYTIGAIRSFAFHQKCSAVDGNVIRVLARYFFVEDDVSKPKTVSLIRNFAEGILPDKEPWIISEALIELGATVCARKPNCQNCPLRSSCQSYSKGKTDLIPFKSSKTKIEVLHRAVAVIQCGDSYLIRKENEKKIMHGLHEFPYFEMGEKGINHKNLAKIILTELNLKVKLKNSLPIEEHSFTRYRVKLYPFMFETHFKEDILGLHWKSIQEIRNLSFLQATDVY